MAGIAGVGCRLGRVVIVFQPGWVGLEESALVDVNLVSVPGPDLSSQLDVGGGAMLSEGSFEPFYFLLGPLGSGSGLPLLDSFLRRLSSSLRAHLLHVFFPDVSGAGAGRWECCWTERAPLFVRSVNLLRRYNDTVSVSVVQRRGAETSMSIIAHSAFECDVKTHSLVRYAHVADK